MRIAFNIAVGVGVVGVGIRLRSHFHREGSQSSEAPTAGCDYPSYTGLIVTFLGLGLVLDNWALAVLAVVPTAGLVYRIHFEERALIEGSRRAVPPLRREPTAPVPRSVVTRS